MIVDCNNCFTEIVLDINCNPEDLVIPTPPMTDFNLACPYCGALLLLTIKRGFYTTKVVKEVN